MKPVIVYVTVPNRKEADRISKALVSERLAACVSIVPAVFSRYRWKGKIETSRELLLIIKTGPRRYEALEKRVRRLHSYKVPEILAVPVIHVNAAYLRWVKTSLR